MKDHARQYSTTLWPEIILCVDQYAVCSYLIVITCFKVLHILCFPIYTSPLLPHVDMWIIAANSKHFIKTYMSGGLDVMPSSLINDSIAPVHSNIRDGKYDALTCLTYIGTVFWVFVFGFCPLEKSGSLEHYSFGVSSFYSSIVHLLHEYLSHHTATCIYLIRCHYICTLHLLLLNFEFRKIELRVHIMLMICNGTQFGNRWHREKCLCIPLEGPDSCFQS